MAASVLVSCRTSPAMLSVLIHFLAVIFHSFPLGHAVVHVNRPISVEDVLPYQTS